MLRLENRNRPLGGVENQPRRGGRVAKGPVKTSLGKKLDLCLSYPCDLCPWHESLCQKQETTYKHNHSKLT